jgi:hypothetical protein
MAEIKVVERRAEQPEVVDRALDFWSRYGRIILIAHTALVVLIGAYWRTNTLSKSRKSKKRRKRCLRRSNIMAPIRSGWHLTAMG